MDAEKLNSVFNLFELAGKAILKRYKSDNFNTSIKSDDSPVTCADKASSKILNEGLTDLFPEIPILDEEKIIPGFEERKNWKEFFLIDPLDGTKEFIKQNNEFCINLARIVDINPVEGWIYQPISGRGWYCKKGSGIFEFNKKGIQQKIEPSNSNSAKICITTSRSFFKPREAEIIKKISQKYSIEIIHKGSSLKQIAIISGKADMYLKAGPCSEWDTAPGQLMVEEFGGSVLRHDNFLPLTYNKPILINPHFVMLNKSLNSPNFIKFLKEIVQY